MNNRHPQGRWLDRGAHQVRRTQAGFSPAARTRTSPGDRRCLRHHPAGRGPAPRARPDHHRPRARHLRGI